MNHLELAQAALDTYSREGGWENQWILNDVWIAARKVSDGVVIAFRGSKDLEDWFRDLQALPAHDSLLGWVHSGFLQGMYEAVKETMPVVVKGNVWVTGHSLGAARAWIYTGLLVKMGFKSKLKGCFTFGTPRPGFPKLRRIISRSGLEVGALANQGDPVCDVPLRIPFLWPYCEPVEVTEVNVEPAAGDTRPLDRHHMALYFEGAKRAFPSDSAGTSRTSNPHP